MRLIRPIVATAFVAFLFTSVACSDHSSGGSTVSDPAIEAITKFIASHEKANGGDGAIDKTKSNWKTSLPKPPQVSFAAGKTYVWKLETSHGVMQFKLLPDVAPMHCSNFIYLTQLGFFDGLPFHRVIRNFMAQGGCPLGTGMGTPGYGLKPEVSATVRHDHLGVLSTAHSQMPNSDGSQFFIMFAANRGLDGQYAIFGDALDDATKSVIAALDKLGNASDGPPTEPITLKKATIEVR